MRSLDLLKGLGEDFISGLSFLVISFGFIGGVSDFFFILTGEGDFTAIFIACDFAFFSLSLVSDFDTCLAFLCFLRSSELEELALLVFDFFNFFLLASMEEELEELLSSLLELESDDEEDDSLDGLLSFLIFFSFYNINSHYCKI